MTTTEIAAKLNEHLKRWADDENPNLVTSRRRFWRPGAYRAGAYVRVTYISYQGETSLRKHEAAQYLEWIEEGNVGKHWQALYDAAKTKERAIKDAPL